MNMRVTYGYDRIIMKSFDWKILFFIKVSTMIMTI